jgi:anti-anti-sigma regulatory factor
MESVQGLRVSDRTIGDYCVIDVSGEAQSPIDLRTLSEYYSQNVSGKKNVALNLKHYDSMITSYFIGIIIGMHKTAKEKGGSFVLIPPADPENLSPLEEMGITKVLTIYNDENILSKGK